jgi:NADPH:quinone reductase-like Zn-dependent oxidoreductase
MQYNLVRGMEDFMQAIQINQYGGSEVVVLKADAPEPELSPNHILIEVHAAAVNPSDWKLRDGLMKDFVHNSFPMTLGGDFSGVIRQVGVGVTGYVVGNEVFGQSDIREMGSGAFAELTAPETSYIALKPKQITHNEAAALPLTGCSALQVINEHIKLTQNQRVLIHGGAGGIGTIAIQMAKHIGAYVIATAGTSDIDYVKQLGADKVIDYQTQQFETLVHDMDAVFDTVGGETYKKSFTVLKKGGIMVSMLEQPNQELMAQYSVTAIAQSSKVTSERLSQLAKLVDEGVIKVKVDKTFPLSQTKEALEYLKTGHPKGKIIIAIKTH